jgi:lantibiotic modifying enzyme
MNAQKFHREVGFEATALKEIQDGLRRLYQLRYTQHAKLETIKDRYSIIPVIKLSDIKLSDIFEYTKEQGEIVKFAVRVTSYDKALDFCYSISLDGNVITVWANTKEDSHRTLNERAYARV